MYGSASVLWFFVKAEDVIRDLVRSRGLGDVDKRQVLRGIPRARAVALVECKAPGVRITQATFEQAARYNVVFKVRYLLVTNGLRHYCCRIDHSNGSVDFVVDIPHHNTLSAP